MRVIKMRKSNIVFIVIGILCIALGIYTFFDPAMTLTGVVYGYGIMAIINGISDIAMYIRLERYFGFAPLVGLTCAIISVMCGFGLLIYPGVGGLIFSLLLPLWFIMHALSRLSQAQRLKHFINGRTYHLTIIVAILCLFLGVIIYLRPFSAFLASGHIAAVFLVLIGIDMIALAHDKS